MKTGIHPEYKPTKVHCTGCGTTFDSMSTVGEINVEICSNCHPFYTGKQKLVDTAGRVDRFRAKAQKAAQIKEAKAKKSTKPKSVKDKSTKANQTDTKNTDSK